MDVEDTIVAIATPPGRGGIGVVRLSGANARPIASLMLRLKRPLEHGRAVFTELIDLESGERLDEAVVTYFAQPRSYTTEDVVEISAHGSPVALRHILAMATTRGARLAAPGEFTMRAFLHGRLDLTQAEAVRDLIESQTLYQAKIAAQQLQGALSQRLQPIKKRLVDLIAVMEAGIDFAEDDVDVLPREQILRRVAEVREPLEKLKTSFAYGKVVHEGFTLAIVGRPNVGKSSLFNRLLERERAIVTAVPGTTRDLVTETMALGGVPVKLIDTAGIRAATDEAESIGIRKSYEALGDADLVLVVIDSSHGLEAGDRDLLESAKGRRIVVAANKADLAPCAAPVLDGIKVLKTSALTGEGIELLREEILSAVSGVSQGEQETGFLTSIRHQRLVEESLEHLAAAGQAVNQAIPHEMIMLDLYGALRPLDAITGQTTADDILNLIFSSFCIGK